MQHETDAAIRQHRKALADAPADADECVVHVARQSMALLEALGVVPMDAASGPT